MDYKQIDPQFADFGNFNYGVIGKALGFPDWVLKNAAGWAQGKADELNNTESIIRMALDPANHGDHPEDQYQIRKGIKAADDAGISRSDLGIIDWLRQAGNQLKYGDVCPGPDLSIPRNRRITDDFQGARNWFQRRAPLALDLDGDGLETTGITASPTLFDHDGDGIKTGTGWLKGDDAFLALDRNGNGTIDNGGELFGVDTTLTNGQKATNGFAALADLDSNHDGQFSNADAQFANVRVWRDLNQNGLSEAGELQSLNTAGIASINLASTASNIALAGGNIQSASGTYTKTNGTTGTAGDFTTGSSGNLDLAQNPFYREFADKIPSTATTQHLPDMQGSGAVRDLREAASLSEALASSLQAVVNAGSQSRASLMNSLDGVIEQWAKSSGFANSKTQAETQGYHLHYLLAGMNPLELTGPGAIGNAGDMVTPEQRAAWQAKMDRITHLENLLAVLEPFNGMTFVNIEAAGARTGLGILAAPQETHDPVSGLIISRDVYVSLSDAQIGLLEQSYGLVMQTRLKGCLDAANDGEWRMAG